MADTSIEWADKVWNPTVGCSKIGQGCKNCYAERFAVRLQAMGKLEYQDTVQDGRWTGRIILHVLRRDFPAVIPYDPDTDTWGLP